MKTRQAPRRGAADLERLLTDGVPAGEGVLLRVQRAWPVNLKDPALGHALELIAPDGRVLGGHLGNGRVEVLFEDPALPELAPLVADGWRVLAHRAGKRAVLRRGDEGVFRKLATPKATKRAAARAATVENVLRRTPGVPLPPARVAVSARRGILDLAPAEGRSLRALLSDSRTPAEVAVNAGRRLGEILVQLAAVRPGDEPDGALPIHTLKDEAAVLERWVTAALQSAPMADDEGRRLRAETSQVAGQLLQLPEARPVLAHRDLHDGQVLVADDGDLTILDWDTAVWTDPCLDAANLLAHLDRLVTQVPDSMETVECARSAFLSALHRRAHPATRRPERLALLIRCAATRIQAVHAFRG